MSIVREKCLTFMSAPTNEASAHMQQCLEEMLKGELDRDPCGKA